MHDVEPVQHLETFKNLQEYLPDLVFWKVRACLLMLLDLLQQVAVVSVFHHDAAIKDRGVICLN